MLTPRSTLTRRVMTALDASPPRIPVLLGGCGSGRTTLLHQLRDRLHGTASLYLDIERTATTPERFLRSVAAAAAVPFPIGETSPVGTRAAFDAVQALFARAGGEPATFLLDEFLELRTFESFPGLRRVLHDFVEGVSASTNRFVLTSRYTARTLRLLRDHSTRFDIIHVPPLTVDDTFDVLGPVGRDGTPDQTHDGEFAARTLHALADGRPAYVRALADELAAMGGHSGSDVVSALAAMFASDGRLAKQCAFCYELRLHRARGYGALKAILDILADEEGLTLTEISQRLQRTPGSTKDYLSWLEDVDLVTARQKHYSFTDPLLRLWVRLHCRASQPTEDDVAREVHGYALPRLPHPVPAPSAPEPAFAMISAGGSGIIEID
jgi:hypothetical protein